MTSQTSKAALKQLQKTTHLVASIRTQQSIVNTRLATELAEIPGNDAADAPDVPDWQHLQGWAIHSLDASADDVRRTDRTYRHHRVQRDQLRGERNTLVGGMSKDLRKVRKTISGVYGNEALPLVGLDAVPARGFLALREQVRTMIASMRDPRMVAELPQPLASQSPLELAALANAWQVRNAHLDELADEIARLHKLVQQSRLLVKESQRRARRLYANVGRLQEGLYRLAGLDDLADRMRVTHRAARQPPTEPIVEPQPEGGEAPIVSRPEPPRHPGSAAAESATTANPRVATEPPAQQLGSPAEPRITASPPPQTRPGASVAASRSEPVLRQQLGGDAERLGLVQLVPDDPVLPWGRGGDCRCRSAPS